MMRPSELWAMVFAITGAFGIPFPGIERTGVQRSGGLVFPTEGDKSHGCRAEDIKNIRKLFDQLGPLAKVGATIAPSDPEYKTYFSQSETPNLRVAQMVKDRYRFVSDFLNDKLMNDFPEVNIVCKPPPNTPSCDGKDAMLNRDQSGKQTIILCPRLLNMIKPSTKKSVVRISLNNGTPIHFDNRGKRQSVCRGDLPKNFGNWVEQFPPSIVLHEMMHLQYGSIMNGTKDCVYGAFWSEKFAAVGDGSASAANADNYAMAAVSKFLRGLCKKRGIKVSIFRQLIPNTTYRSWEGNPLAKGNNLDFCNIPTSSIQWLKSLDRGALGVTTKRASLSKLTR